MYKCKHSFDVNLCNSWLCECVNIPLLFANKRALPKVLPHPHPTPPHPNPPDLCTCTYHHPMIDWSYSPRCETQDTHDGDMVNYRLRHVIHSQLAMEFGSVLIPWIFRFNPLVRVWRTPNNFSDWQMVWSGKFEAIIIIKTVVRVSPNLANVGFGYTVLGQWCPYIGIVSHTRFLPNRFC